MVEKEREWEGKWWGSVFHIRRNKEKEINDFRWNPTWREGVNKNLLFKGCIKYMTQK